MDKMGTICKGCNKATSVVYDPDLCLCANCHIERLENKNADIEYELSERDRYKEMYRESEKKVSEYFKYKVAFEVLVKEVQK